jgi:hypothetical protein
VRQAIRAGLKPAPTRANFPSEHVLSSLLLQRE